jgi:hypothetical protein
VVSLYVSYVCSLVITAFAMECLPVTLADFALTLIIVFMILSTFVF